MQTSRLTKLARLSGAGSIILLMVGSGVLGIYDYLPTANRLVDFFSENAGKSMILGYVGLLSTALLIWFAGTVYTFFYTVEGGPGRLSMISFAGCVASAIVLGLGFTVLIALGSRAGASEGLSAAEAVTLYDLYGTLMGQMGAFTFAVFIGASSILILRTGLFPAWFGWTSALIALGLLSPFGYFVLLFALLWVLGFSIALYRRAS